MFENNNKLKLAYNSVNDDLEDALLENESNSEVIYCLKNKLETYEEKAVKNSEKIKALTKDLEATLEDKKVAKNKLEKKTTEFDNKIKAFKTHKSEAKTINEENNNKNLENQLKIVQVKKQQQS
jgi:hypothetical protein